MRGSKFASPGFPSVFFIKNIEGGSFDYLFIINAIFDELILLVVLFEANLIIL